MSDKIHRRFFNSAAEFFSACGVDAKVPALKYDRARKMFHTTITGDKFHGKTSKVCEAFRRHDFAKGASLIDGTVGELKSAAFDCDRWQFVNRLVDGDDVDVGRWLEGDERCWSGVRRRRTEKKVARVFAQMGGSCSRSREELAVCGAVAVSVVEMLEASGVAVELWASATFDGSYFGGDSAAMFVRLKGSDGFSDLGLMNFIIGDSHVFRNIMFRAVCLLGVDNGVDTHTNMGFASALTPKWIGLEDVEAEDTTIIPFLYQKNEAKTWLKKFVKTRKEKK